MIIDKYLLLRAQILVGEAQKKVRLLWLTKLSASFRAALLALVLTIEFELLYRTFKGIAGKDNEYWSPDMMALTGVVMVSAYHLLNKGGHNSAIARVIHAATPVLLGTYLAGLGLLTAGVVSLDTIGMLVAAPGEIVIGALPTEIPDKPWLEALFQNVINPLAVGLFALGIGGVAVINLFVASELIDGIKRAVIKIRDTKPEAARLRAEFEALERNLARARELQFDEGDLALWPRSRLISETALQLGSVIQGAAARHRHFVKSNELSPSPGPLDLKRPVDSKPIERDLKKIEALDIKAITKILQSQTETE